MPGRRLLIIDDDDDVRESLEALMVEEGFDVAVARSAPAALSDMTFGRVVPHAILIDMQMPSMSGAQFLAIIQRSEEWAGIPVVLCSGSSLHPELSVGAFAVLQKPFDIEQLIAILELACARRHD